MQMVVGGPIQVVEVDLHLIRVDDVVGPIQVVEVDHFHSLVDDVGGLIQVVEVDLHLTDFHRHSQGFLQSFV